MGRDRMLRALAAAIACIALAGCAAGISRQARSQVTYWGPFSEMQENPDAHKKDVVLLGGRIIENDTLPHGSELAVLQTPLGSYDRPGSPDASEGRFLVRSNDFLDPGVYEKGAMVTVVGEIVGSESRKIGDFNYVHPIIQEREIKLWKEPMWLGNGIHFSVGVGATF